MIAQREGKAFLLSIAILFFTAGRTTFGAPNPTAPTKQTQVLQLIQKLNQIPERELDQTKDPVLSLLKSLDDLDGPDFQNLRLLAATEGFAQTLTPSVKCIVGLTLAQRWDTFLTCGNLFLGGLRSPNETLQELARRKMLVFIQPAHLPEIASLLDVPTSRERAYRILKDVSGKTYPPQSHIWKVWYDEKATKLDIVEPLLKNTADQMAKRPVHAFQQSRFWYAPMAIRDVQKEEANRTASEEAALSEWRNWFKKDVTTYLNNWSRGKPFLDRVVHQPDPRVNRFLEKLLGDPGYGDYASLVLAWRKSSSSLPLIEQNFKRFPTPGRALARGSMGDKMALRDLVAMIDAHPQPLTFELMDKEERAAMLRLHALGVISAEQAFELLCHQSFGLSMANTAKAKKKALKAARHWLDLHEHLLLLDRRRGFYVLPSQ